MSKIENKEYLTFGDILLKPAYSEITSRSQVSLEVKIKDFTFASPLIPANMKSIMCFELACKIYENKSLGIHHRFSTIEEQIQFFESLKNKYGNDVFNYIGCSVGVKEQDKENAKLFLNLGVKIFCIDIAHGHSKECGEMCSYLKNLNKDMLLIAGNVATIEGSEYLWNNGADVVKVGIGGGCLKGDARILMSNGTYKNITEIKEGDSIIDGKGNPTKVNKLIYSGRKTVSSIKHNGFHKPLYATEDHKFYVNNKDFEWKELSDLNKNVLSPKNINFNLKEDFNIQLNKSNIKSSYDIGYIFGVSLGDNLIKNNNSITWVFDKEDVALKLSKSINKEFNCDVKIKNKIVNISEKQIVKLLNFNKLPEEFLCSNKEYLQGLFDGLVDNQISDDLNELFMFLNFKLNGYFTSDNNKDNFQHYMITNKINHIEEVDTYDLEVESEDHSFIANNIIVHNSICTTRLKAGAGVPQVSALEEIYEWNSLTSSRYLALSDGIKDVRNNRFIISDGGIRDVGDFVKALAFSNMVMAGNMFSGCEETPEEVLEIDGQKYKKYAGSSTHKTTNIEGVVSLVHVKGKFKDILETYSQGIRSGLSYAGADNLETFRSKAKFVRITNEAKQESGTHDVKVIG